MIKISLMIYGIIILIKRIFEILYGNMKSIILVEIINDNSGMFFFCFFVFNLMF